MNIIKIIHNFKQIVSVEGDYFNDGYPNSIGQFLYETALRNKNSYIFWVHETLSNHINDSYILENLQERKMISYSVRDNYFSNNIGFIDESVFINVNKNVTYPTWQMSSQIGIIATNFVVQTDKELWFQNQSFDFILNAVAKMYQPLGLFCYSDPNLILPNTIQTASIKSSNFELFIFVKKHYKWVWVYLLLLNLILYQKKFPILAFLNTFFFKRTYLNPNKTLQFSENVEPVSITEETIDVIIPTIGRKNYLYDVLKDLSVQTHLPKNVIIVEQNPNENSVSELDYLSTESWPFEIKHIFTHQTGACQARNKALDLVTSEWVFFADDDITFKTLLLRDSLKNLIQNHLEVGVLNCLLKNEKKQYFILTQTTIFGSGCSICKSVKIQNLRFDTNLEYGFGEDSEFGFQLRNSGTDVFYLPNPEIIHLKAPIGGFRTKFVHPWNNDTLNPKPFPTIMYVKQKYLTEVQLLGYKTRLFLKSNGYKFWKWNSFTRQWKSSKKWAKYLMNNA